MKKNLICLAVLFIAGSALFAAELPKSEIVFGGITETKDDNKFISYELKLAEPVNISGKKISFTAQSFTPENMDFFSIDFLNKGSEKPCIGFVTWGKAIDGTAKNFVLNPKQAKKQQPQWRVTGLAEEPATQIDRVRITIGTIVNNVELKVSVKNLAAEIPAEFERFPVLEYAEIPVDIKHPATIYSAEDIERGRDNVKRYDWAKKVLNTARERTKQFMTYDLELMIPEDDIFNFVGCPKCGKGDDSWVLRSDGKSIECRYCKALYPSAELEEKGSAVFPIGTTGRTKTLTFYEGERRMKLGDDDMGNRYFLSGALRNRQFQPSNHIATAANIYALTGEMEYAQRVHDVLVRFAEVYPNYTLKFRPFVYESAEFNYMAGKLGGWKFGDSVRIANMAIAYDLTADSGCYSAEDKVKIENGIFREYVNMIAAHRPDADVTTNAVPAHQTAAAICAVLLKNDDLMRNYVLNGEGSFIPMIKKMYYRDGVWNENSASYCIMSNTPLLQLTEVINAYNRLLPEDERIDTSLWRNIFISLAYQIMPDGYPPPVNDSTMFDAFPAQYAELTYRNYPTARNLALLSNAVNLAGGTEYSVFKRDAKLPEVDENELKIINSTHVVAGSNWVFLRPQHNSKSTALIFDYGFYPNGHSHFANLNFSFYDHNRELVIDYGYMGWAHPIRRWQVSPLAHNMVTVDGQLPKTSRQGKLLALSESEFVQIAAGEGANAFPDLKDDRRALFLISIDENNHYVVDINRVRGGKEHLYTLQIEGGNELLTPSPATAEKLSFGTDGYFNGADYVVPVKKFPVAEMPVMSWNNKGIVTRLFWTPEADEELLLSKVPGNRIRSQPAREVDLAHFSSRVRDGKSDFAGVISASEKVHKVSRIPVNGDAVVLKVEYDGGVDLAAVNYQDVAVSLPDYPEVQLAPGYSVVRLGKNGWQVECSDKIYGKIVDIMPNKTNKIMVKLTKDENLANINYIFFDNYRDGACRIAEITEENGLLLLTLDAVDDKFMKEGDTFTAFKTVVKK